MNERTLVIGGKNPSVNMWIKQNEKKNKVNDNV